MNNIKPRNVLNTTQYLLEKLTGLLLLNTLVLHNIIKQLAAGCIFHDQIQFLGRLNNFIKLDHLWMLHNFKDVDFPGHTLIIRRIDDFALLEYFHGHARLREYVHTDLDFAKGALADCFAEDILTNSALVRLQIKFLFRNLVHNHLLAFIGLVEIIFGSGHYIGVVVLSWRRLVVLAFLRIIIILILRLLLRPLVCLTTRLDSFFILLNGLFY